MKDIINGIKSSINNPIDFVPMTPNEDPLDSQVGGSHYKDLAIQPIEFIHANNLGFMEGNIIKYAARHKAKNGAEDIRKIIHYAKLILKYQYNEET